MVRNWQLFMYDFFTIFVSSAALLIYNLTQLKTKKMFLSKISLSLISHVGSRSSSSRIYLVFAVIETVLISLYQHGLVSPLNHLFGDIFGTGVNYFGMIITMPFLLPLLCWVIGVDPFKQIDLITPAYPLALFFMKLGCFSVGCCAGIPVNFRMFSPFFVLEKFPIQLVEAGVALFLFFFLLSYKKKNVSGTLLPTYTTLYCSIRFFTEFLRNESNVLFCFKIYHILCFVGIIFGLTQLLILHKYKNFLVYIFENNLPTLLLHKKKTHIK